MHSLPASQCTTPGPRAAMLVACALLACACPLGAQEGGPLRAEYFVRQEAGEALWVRSQASEAEFSARIRDADGALLLHSRITGERLAPLFQYLGPPAEPRELDIELLATAPAQRSTFELELSRLTVHDERGARLARAYRDLSFGLEALDSDSPANWSIKVGSLGAAGEAFAGFGMQELSLWSRLHAAHAMHRHLGDAHAALDATEHLLREISAARHPRIELAALQLRGRILFGLREAGELEAASGAADLLQAALQAGGDAARALGLDVEQAAALHLQGRDFAARGQTGAALQRYREALGLAEEAGAPDLAVAIRENLLELHRTAGDLGASGAVLRDIESGLEGGGGEELALNLLEQGRLMLGTWRPRAAHEVLDRALQLTRNSLTRAAVKLELARAHHELGDPDAALAELEAVLVNADEGGFRRPNPLLDVQGGLRLLASLYRARGDAAAMRRARAAGGTAPGTPAERAAHHYEQALDALATGGPGPAVSAALDASAAEGARAGLARWGWLGLLQACAHGLEPAGGCGADSLAAAREGLRAAGPPRDAAEADWLYARILLRQGRREAALQVLEGLVADLHFWRQRVPGVLGAWFAERQDPVFDRYLALAAAGEAERSLLAFSRIRFAERNGQDPAGGADPLRLQLARRAEPGSSPQGQEVAQAVRAARAEFDARHAFLTPAGLEARLQTLPPGSALLAFDVGGASPRAWRAGAAGVRSVRLSPRVADLVRERTVTDPGWRSEAGTLLLHPLGDDLPESVHWLPTGPLLGLPLETLSYRGRPFGEGRRVIGVQDFPRPGPGAPPAWPDRPRVFLAGQPAEFTVEPPERLALSPELAAVRDRFVGPGLHIVQGSALLADEFRHTAWAEADLLHLAMPGRIDLAAPERSYLELAEPAAHAGPGRLGPEALRGLDTRARLAVLSGVTVDRAGAGRFASRLPLVSELLEAGAGAVALALFEVPEDERAALVAGFYRQLAEGHAPAAALARARATVTGVTSPFQLHQR